MKKLVSVILCTLIVLNIFSFVALAETTDVYKTSVVVKSSCDGFKKRTIYFYNDICYMNIADICQLTRSEYTLNNSILSITHGSRKITVNLNKKTMTEGTMIYTVKCHSNKNGVILLQAYPVLTYLGATLGIDNGSLVVDMPLVTLWEAVERTGNENYVDLTCFGDKDDQYNRLFWDNLLFALTGNLGMYFGNALQVQAMCTAISVDPLCYTAGFNEKLKLDKNCVSILNYIEASEDFSGNILNLSSKSSLTICNTILDYIKGATVAQDFLNEYIDTGSSVLEGYDYAIQFYSNFSQNKKNAVDSTEMLTALSDWTTDECTVKETVSDAVYKLNKDNAIHTAINETFLNNIPSALLQLAATATGVEEYYELISKSLDVGVWVHKQLYGEHNQVDYAENEIATMYLLCLKQDILHARENVGGTITDENYNNEKHLEDYRLLNLFYYKTLIASNNAYIELIKTSDNGNVDSVISQIEKNTQLFAQKLFLLQNATVKAFPKFKSISKSNLWDNKNHLGLKTEKVEGGIAALKNVQAVLIKSNIPADTIQFYHCDNAAFEYDCAIVCKNGKYGTIDFNGSILCKPQFPTMYYSETMAFQRDYKIMFYEPINGEHIVDKDGSVYYSDRGGWGYDMDPIPYIYNDELIFFDMFSGIVEDTESIKSTLINRVVWDDILPVQKMTGYSETRSGYTGFAEPILESDKYAFYDRNKGKLITDYMFDDYDDVIGFNEGILAVESNGKWGFMKDTGEMITDFRYSPTRVSDYGYYTDPDEEEINTCVNGYIAVQENGKWGLLDSNGETVIPPKYENISQVHSSGTFFAETDGVWSLYKLL